MIFTKTQFLSLKGLQWLFNEYRLDCRCMEVIVDGNNTDHNGSSYIVRVTKMGRLITCSSKHIMKTPIMTE